MRIRIDQNPTRKIPNKQAKYMRPILFEWSDLNFDFQDLLRPPGRTVQVAPYWLPRTLKALRTFCNSHRCIRAPMRRPRKQKPTCECVGFEHFLADPRQAVDTVAEVDRLDRYQDACVRSDLNHDFLPHRVRLSAVTSGIGAPFI
jgi:hypothetical protein